MYCTLNVPAHCERVTQAARATVYMRIARPGVLYLRHCRDNVARLQVQVEHAGGMDCLDRVTELRRECEHRRRPEPALLPQFVAQAGAKERHCEPRAGRRPANAEDGQHVRNALEEFYDRRFLLELRLIVIVEDLHGSEVP